jgi:hypothetical protein
VRENKEKKVRERVRLTKPWLMSVRYEIVIRARADKEQPTQASDLCVCMCECMCVCVCVCVCVCLCVCVCVCV